MKRPSSSPLFHRRRSAGFSLLEILIVVGIMAALAGLSVSSFSAITKSIALDSSASKIIASVNLARQTAMNLNRTVEVRLYRPQPSDPSDRAPAIRILVEKGVNEEGDTEYKDIAKIQYLEKEIVFDERSTYSSLFSSDSGIESGEADTLPGSQVSYPYNSFQFKPNGTTTLDTTKQYFVTIHRKNAPLSNGKISGLPGDFVTIEINPSNGKTRQYRPGS